MSETKTYDWDYDARLPAGLYDVAANETWLEEMAAKGYAIQRIQGTRVYFVKGEAKAVRFRMQPLQRKGETGEDDRLAVYRDLGWEYVGSVGDLYHLWCCGDPAAPELDTDPVVQADGYRYLKRRMVRTAVTEAVIILSVLLLCAALTAGGSTALRSTLRETVPLRTLCSTIALICLIPWEIMEVVTMLRLLKRLKTGIPLVRPRPYRTKQWVQRVMLGSYLAFIILQGVNLFWPVGNGDILGWSAMDGDVPKAGVVYVDARVLDPAATEVGFRRAVTKVHELASRVTEVEMYQSQNMYPGYGVVNFVADTTCYDLRFSFLVPLLVEDIRYTFRNWEPFEEVETPCLDRFLITDHADRGNIVIAVKGNRVLELFYSGQTDLRTLAAYFAELLSA